MVDVPINKSPETPNLGETTISGIGFSSLKINGSPSLQSTPSNRPRSEPLKSIEEIMTQSRFSQKLSGSVFGELDSRTQSVIKRLPPPSERRNLAPNRRFSGAHRSRFQRMESIASHYAAARKENQPQEVIQKKRKTLTGMQRTKLAREETPSLSRSNKENNLNRIINPLPRFAQPTCSSLKKSQAISPKSRLPVSQQKPTSDQQWMKPVSQSLKPASLSQNKSSIPRSKTFTNFQKPSNVPRSTTFSIPKTRPPWR